MTFSESFFSMLIVFALTGIGIAAITLIVLFFKDIKTKKLW